MEKREMKEWGNLVRLAVAMVFLIGLMMMPASVSANPDNQVSITLPYSTMDVGANFTDAQYSVRLTVDDAIPAAANVTMANYITIYAAGDIGTDLALSAADITGIERVVLGVDPSTITSDANNDSSINSVDLTKTELVVL